MRLDGSRGREAQRDTPRCAQPSRATVETPEAQPPQRSPLETPAVSSRTARMTCRFSRYDERCRGRSRLANRIFRGQPLREGLRLHASGCLTFDLLCPCSCEPAVVRGLEKTAAKVAYQVFAPFRGGAVPLGTDALVH